MNIALKNTLNFGLNRKISELDNGYRYMYKTKMKFLNSIEKRKISYVFPQLKELLVIFFKT